MAPPECFLDGGVDPTVAYLMNRLDDDEFAGILTFADTWMEADFDTALRVGMDANKLPERHAAARPSGPAVTGGAQRLLSLSMSQIQLARLRTAWTRKREQTALWDQMNSSDLQQQHDVILGQWGWEAAPRTQPKHTIAMSSSPSQACSQQVTAKVATPSHLAHKPDTKEAPTERHGALTKPLLEDEAGTPEPVVNLQVEDDEEEAHAPKHLLYASYALALIYFLTGLIYGIFRFGWSLVDSFYFVTVTITTVGYGDLTFNGGDAFDKVFGAVYVFVGVVIISVAAGVILNEWQLKAEAMVAKKMKKNEEDIAGGQPPKFDFNAEVLNVFADVLKTFSIIGVGLAVGSAGMMILEDWSFSDSFYFCSITMTTVGYGDLVPQNGKSKVFVTIYILFAFGVLASSMSAVGAVPFRIQELKKIEKCLSLLGDSLEAEELRALCECREIVKIRNPMQIQASANDPHVLRSEFVLWQLTKQGKLKMDDIAPCLATFDSLDLDGSGNLNQEDIDIYLKHQEDKNHQHPDSARI